MKSVYLVIAGTRTDEVDLFHNVRAFERGSSAWKFSDACNAITQRVRADELTQRQGLAELALLDEEARQGLEDFELTKFEVVRLDLHEG